jgi:hypothetical protein
MSTNRRVYAEKEGQLMEKYYSGHMGEEQLLSRLANYCSLATYYTRASIERNFLSQDPKSFASKPFAIALDVIRHWREKGGKAVVMLHRLHGWKAMCMVMHELAKAANVGLNVTCFPPCLPHEDDKSPGR